MIANSWMNTPVGFTLRAGQPVDIDPIAAMANPAAFQEVLHVTCAAYAATGFVVAGIHAAMLLRDPANGFHQRALQIALAVGAVAALIQPLTGDVAARAVARQQPIKLAAFEGLFESSRGAPLAIGGIPDAAARITRYAIEVPYLLSLLAYRDPFAMVRGLDSFPEDQWPAPLPAIHIAFQVMVGAGMAMAAVALWAGWLVWRRQPVWDSPWFLRALVAAAPLGLIAVEAGWVVTEVGRQP